MMWLLWALTASLSGVGYQASSKTLSPHISPFMYGMCIGLTISVVSGSILAGQYLNGQKVVLPSGNLWGWLAFGALAGGAIDIASFMMYRSGAPFSVARTMVGSLTVVLMLLLGMVLFKEQVTWQQTCGVGLCVVGLAMIAFYRI